MNTITIYGTGKRSCFHDHYNPLVCKSDKDLPKMYNQGWNSFRFVGGEPNFIGNNIETNKVQEYSIFKKEETQILVLRSDGSSVSGYFIRTTNKNTGEIREVFHFD